MAVHVEGVKYRCGGKCCLVLQWKVGVPNKRVVCICARSCVCDNARECVCIVHCINCILYTYSLLKDRRILHLRAVRLVCTQSATYVDSFSVYLFLDMCVSCVIDEHGHFRGLFPFHINLR